MISKVNIESEREFNHYSSFDNVVETGLIFQFLDAATRNIPEKDDNHNIPLETGSEDVQMIQVPIRKEEVFPTYQKVIEVYEMNEAEINIANKIRYILKLIFKGFFKENVTSAWCTGISYGFVAYDLLDQKYLAALIMFTYSLLYTDIRNGFKMLADYFSSRKRLELEADLKRHDVLDYTEAMINKDEVKMYVKSKVGRECQR